MVSWGGRPDEAGGTGRRHSPPPARQRPELRPLQVVLTSYLYPLPCLPPVVSFFFSFVKQRNPSCRNSRGRPSQGVVAAGETAGCLGSLSGCALATRAHAQWRPSITARPATGSHPGTWGGRSPWPRRWPRSSAGSHSLPGPLGPV